jgi:ankyrin repeat protein
VRSEKTGSVKLLLSKGADVRLENEEGLSPLDEAASNGNIEIVKLLIGHMPDINKDSPEIEAAMEHARAEGHKAIVEFLRGYVSGGRIHDRL